MGLKPIAHVCLGFVVVLGLGLYITNIVFSFKYKNYEFENESIIKTVDSHLNTRLLYSWNARNECLVGEEVLNLGVWNGSYYDRAKHYTIFNGKRICVLKNGTIFKNLINQGQIISKNENCPLTYKSCGIVDTLNRKLCVDQNEGCPINKDDIDNYRENLFISNQKLDNDNKMYLNEEGDDKKIISIVKVGEDFPCIRDNETIWETFQADEYPHPKECSSILGKKIDDRYVRFDNFKTNKTQLYYDNGLSRYIKPDSSQKDKIIHLYGGPLIGMKLEKRDFNYEQLLSIQKLVNTCSRVMKIFSYIMLGALVGPIIAGISAAKGIEGVHIMCSLLLGGIAIVIGFLVDFILCIIIYVNVQRIEWRIVDFSKICDEYTNEMLKEVVTKYSSNYSFALAIIIVLSLLVFFSILAVIFYRCTK